MRLALALALVTGCAPAATCELDAPLTAEPEAAWAVVSSDYASSAITLLGPDGALVREGWLSSGSAPPGIVASLSGDVAIASGPITPCVVAVVDRFGTDVVSFLDHCAGEVVSQVDVGSSFRANPHDVMRLDERRVLVSRHEPNPGADDPLGAGNDLLVVDWRDGEVLHAIDLSALDAEVDGERLPARPSRVAPLGRFVVIGLGRASLDFMVSGPGAVAVLDPESGDLEALTLDGLEGCDEVDGAPGGDAALVTCGGPAFVQEDARRAGAGLATLALDGGEVVVRHVWRAAEHPEAPVFNAWGVPLSADRAVAVAMGDLREGVNDRVAVIDLPSGRVEPLFEAGSAFVVGDGAWDPQRELLLVPDAHEGAARRFSGEALEPLPAAPTGPCTGLPPREIRPLSI